MKHQHSRKHQNNNSNYIKWIMQESIRSLFVISIWTIDKMEKNLQYIEHIINFYFNIF